MSRFSGPQLAGARRRAREQRHAAAVERNTRTPQERTAWFRRQRARVRAALADLPERSVS